MKSQESEKSSAQSFAAPPTKVIDSASLTSTVKKIKAKPKDPEKLQLKRNLLNIIEEWEMQKSEARLQAPLARKKNKGQITSQSESKQETSGGSFSLTKMLLLASIVVSLSGLYYKRKELMRFVKPETEAKRHLLRENWFLTKENLCKKPRKSRKGSK